jgi:hypothetical protein
MQNDPRAEWERLTRLYSEKSDEELLELAEDFGNLTEVAQQVLRDELKKRKLAASGAKPAAAPDNRLGFGGWNPVQDRAPGPQADTVPNGGSGGEPRESTWRTQLCECDTDDQANLLHMTLMDAGIQSWVELPDPESKLGFTLPKIFVPADQLAHARQIAAQPIPKEIVDQSKAAFVAPACLKCGAPDPLLESVDSSNHWSCESCGAEWSDAQPAAP